MVFRLWSHTNEQCLLGFDYFPFLPSVPGYQLTIWKSPRIPGSWPCLLGAPLHPSPPDLGFWKICWSCAQQAAVWVGLGYTAYSHRRIPTSAEACPPQLRVHSFPYPETFCALTSSVHPAAGI